MLKPLLTLALLLSLGTSGAEAAKRKKNKIQKLTGTVQSCHDGDTCRVLVKNKSLKIRFAGIDTPELSQQNGKDAKNFTESKLKGRTVDLECEGTSFDRLTCVVFLEGRNINREIILNGWAFESLKYSKGEYAPDVQTAKNKRLGIWQNENLVSPYCYRHKTSKHCRVSQLYMP